MGYAGKGYERRGVERRAASRVQILSDRLRNRAWAA